MPGEGIQPTVEEFLTRMAPHQSPGAGRPRPEPPPKTLDEAIARRDAETERQRQLALAHEEAQKNASDETTAVIADFLGRRPRTRHRLTRYELEVRSGMFGRVKTEEHTEPIGEGWWLTATAKSAPNKDAWTPGPWIHECVFLLPDGRLVRGMATNLHDESYPKSPPARTDIRLEKVDFIPPGERVSAVLRHVQLPTVLVSYL